MLNCQNTFLLRLNTQSFSSCLIKTDISQLTLKMATLAKLIANLKNMDMESPIQTISFVKHTISMEKEKDGEDT